jgi:hypothetical protein
MSEHQWLFRDALQMTAVIFGQIGQSRPNVICRKMRQTCKMWKKEREKNKKVNFFLII